MNVTHTANSVDSSEGTISPICSVLSVLLPLAGRWIGCQGASSAEVHSDPRAMVQFIFCLGGSVFLGVVLAIIGGFRNEPTAARVAAAIFQCAALAWFVSIAFR